MLPDGALSINSQLALMRAWAERRRPPELILADEEHAALLLLFIGDVSACGKHSAKRGEKTQKERISIRSRRCPSVAEMRVRSSGRWKESEGKLGRIQRNRGEHQRNSLHR